MTLFFLGRLDGWSQTSIEIPGKPSLLPRNKKEKWDKDFFKCFHTDSPQFPPRSSPLGNFLGAKLKIDQDKLGSPFLLFELSIYNEAFNGGEAIDNPSFLKVKKWSQYDALLIFPMAKTLVFIEAKVKADGHHNAGPYPDVPQPLRNVEAAFFITNLEDSKYKDWDFRYVLICPKSQSNKISESNKKREIEKFFSGDQEGGHQAVLKKYTEKYSVSPETEFNNRWEEYGERWDKLRANLSQKLLVVSWCDLLDELRKNEFETEEYFKKLETVQVDGINAREATQSRWQAANIPL